MKLRLTILLSIALSTFFLCEKAESAEIVRKIDLSGGYVSNGTFHVGSTGLIWMAGVGIREWTDLQGILDFSGTGGGSGGSGSQTPWTNNIDGSWQSISNVLTYVGSNVYVLGTLYLQNPLAVPGLTINGNGVVNGDFTVNGTFSQITTIYISTNVYAGTTTNFVTETVYSTNIVYQTVITYTNAVTTNTVDTYVNIGGSFVMGAGSTFNATGATSVIFPMFQASGTNVTASGQWDFTGADLLGVGGGTVTNARSTDIWLTATVIDGEVVIGSTNTPLFSFTETDPIWGAASNSYLRGTNDAAHGQVPMWDTNASPPRLVMSDPLTGSTAVTNETDPVFGSWLSTNAVGAMQNIGSYTYTGGEAEVTFTIDPLYNPVIVYLIDNYVADAGTNAQPSSGINYGVQINGRTDKYRTHFKYDTYADIYPASPESTTWNGITNYMRLQTVPTTNDARSIYYGIGFLPSGASWTFLSSVRGVSCFGSGYAKSLNGQEYMSFYQLGSLSTNDYANNNIITQLVFASYIATNGVQCVARSNATILVRGVLIE